jgi:L-aminopeptidase/D-esterase-like protein
MAGLLTIRDVPGIRVGHWTDEAGGTGCTVVLAPDAGAVGGCEVRGSAPGTRETDLFRHTALGVPVNAICLAGGSAFGLAAADGVVRRLAERGVGFPTGVRPVPIVPAAILFDLGVGSPDAIPDAAAGYAATLAAESGAGRLEGRVGAGTGATVAKLGGVEMGRPGGIGSAALQLSGGRRVGALVAVNAFGNIHDLDGRLVVGTPVDGGTPPSFGNTTLVVVATDASIDRGQAQKLAELAHDSLARAIRPVHTMFDGDVAFTLGTGAAGTAPHDAFLALAEAADVAVRTAVVRAVSD